MPTPAVQTEIRSSTIAELHEHAGEAIKANHRETGHGKLDVDWGRMRAVEGAGMAVILAAWHGEVIVGYSLGFSFRELDTNDLIYSSHVIFVLPEYRKGNLGGRLAKATEGAAGAAGCVRVVWVLDELCPLVPILARMGYVAGARVYSKELGP